MSSSIFLRTSFSHMPGSIPSREVTIQEDILGTQRMLKQYKFLTKPSMGGISYKVFEEINNCTAVFNQNVLYVQSKLEEKMIPDLMTEDEFKASSNNYANNHSYPERQEALLKDFRTECERQMLARLRQLDQKSVCKELIFHLNSLKVKIEKFKNGIQERYSNTESKFENFPLKEVPSAEKYNPYCFGSYIRAAVYTEPESRWWEETPATTTTTTTTTAPSNTLPVAVSHAVNEGQALGICSSANSWGAPVALSLENGKWVGEIPKDVEFKFVLLQNGAILKWEQGPNRKANESNVQFEKIKF